MSQIYTHNPCKIVRIRYWPVTRLIKTNVRPYTTPKHFQERIKQNKKSLSIFSTWLQQQYSNSDKHRTGQDSDRNVPGLDRILSLLDQFQTLFHFGECVNICMYSFGSETQSLLACLEGKAFNKQQQRTVLLKHKVFKRTIKQKNLPV